jgi:hypothetical protein
LETCYSFERVASRIEKAKGISKDPNGKDKNKTPEVPAVLSSQTSLFYPIKSAVLHFYCPVEFVMAYPLLIKFATKKQHKLAHYNKSMGREAAEKFAKEAEAVETTQEATERVIANDISIIALPAIVIISQENDLSLETHLAQTNGNELFLGKHFPHAPDFLISSQFCISLILI